MPRFADIIEEVTSLSLEEMEEVQRILNKAVIEKKREQIALKHKETEEQYKSGQLKFYDNASDLLNALNEE
jgi:hypothetical protein